MPPHISIRPIQPSDFAAWKPLLRATTLSMAAKARLLCPIRSRRPLSNVSLRRFFDSGEPVHALVATARDASSQAGGEQLVGLVHYLFHRSTTRLHDVCYLQDLFVAPEHRGQRIAADLIAAVYAAAGERGSSRVYWTTQTTNTSGRALYDKLAKHAGFIVYSHEL